DRGVLLGGSRGRRTREGLVSHGDGDRRARQPPATLRQRGLRGSHGPGDHLRPGQARAVGRDQASLGPGQRLPVEPQHPAIADEARPAARRPSAVGRGESRSTMTTRPAVRPPTETALDRFVRYASMDTQSAEDVEAVPTTPGQWDLARLLVDELRALDAQ